MRKHTVVLLIFLGVLISILGVCINSLFVIFLGGFMVGYFSTELILNNKKYFKDGTK